MAYSGVVPPRLKPAIPLRKFKNGHWHFDQQMGGKEYVGFIYIIRDKVLKRFYLGKKNYRTDGRLRAGEESDWKRYTSSSNILKALIKDRPIEEFDFICIEQYRTKGTLGYAETWTLCDVEAPTTPVWYNEQIEKVSWKVRERITDKHKQRVKDAINWKEFCDD